MRSSPPRSHRIAFAPVWKQLEEFPNRTNGPAGTARPIRRAQEWGQWLQVNPEFTTVGASSRIAYDGDPHDPNQMFAVWSDGHSKAYCP